MQLELCTVLVRLPLLLLLLLPLGAGLTSLSAGRAAWGLFSAALLCSAGLSRWWICVCCYVFPSLLCVTVRTGKRVSDGVASL
jgi:hypothetical protein